MKCIWALFDSGNGCYKRAVCNYFEGICEIYSIGVDMGNKNDHFINLNLADMSEYFGRNVMFDELDKLPKPDIILASPPCESFSIGSTMKDGNACWQTLRTSNLLGEVLASVDFTPRTKKQIDTHGEKHPNQKKHWWKNTYNRLNGELCAFNTLRIIEKYAPSVWVIENPQSSKLWNYYWQIHDFKGIKNVAHYNYYDATFPKKPTTFLSNICLGLKTTTVVSKFGIGKNKDKIPVRGYNKRSDIPISLVKSIIGACLKEIDKENSQ